MYWLYVTVKAVLSGETAMAAVPAGHPDPLTVITSIIMLSVGGDCPMITGGESRERTAPPIAIRLSMGFLPIFEMSSRVHDHTVELKLGT
jgi:hypothetical protein